MNLALKLSGDNNQILKAIISQKEDINIICYTDKNLSYCQNIKDGVEVKTIFQVVSLYNKGLCDGILFSSKIKYNLLEKMISEAICLGIDENDCFVALPEIYIEYDKKYIVQWKNFKCLPYIEFHVADHCNLNCKGCVHFSPLVNKENFIDKAEIEKNLKYLKKSVTYIENIHILGGEPLLSKELPEIIEITAKIYEYSQITLVTNGILITKMTPELIQSIRKHNVIISISLYKPMYKKMGDIIEFLRDNAIECTYTAPFENFAYTFNRDGGLAKDVSRINCTCPNLYDGKLYICPIIAYAKYYNSYFNGDYINLQEGSLDISKQIDYMKLKDFLKSPVSICDKCLYISKEKEHRFEWEQVRKPQMSDWIY